MSGEATVAKSSQIALWIQPDGPNTKPQYLGCHDVDDIVEPGGASNLLLCFDHGAPSGYKVVGSTKEPPGPIATAITTYIQKTADYLEDVPCSFTMFEHWWNCGKPDVFTNYIRSFAVAHLEIGDKTLAGMSRRNEDIESTQAFAITGWPPVLRLFKLGVMRQSTSETEGLNDVAFCNVAKCADECGEAAKVCEVGCAVGDAMGGTSPSNTADVICTEDAGSTWTATGNDPFAGGEDIASYVCFYVGADTIRRVVARGTADAQAPAEIAYSDNGGTTWTNVSMTWTPGGAAAPNGQYAIAGNSLFALDQYHIWLVTTDGYIYFSDDGAFTWTVQEQGDITRDDWIAVWFANENDGFVGGVGNVVARTTNGGATWAAVVGPVAEALNDVQCVTRNRDSNIWWAGYDGNTRLWYTTDNGASWTQRAFTGSGVVDGEVADIAFYNDLCGFMISNTDVPLGTVHHTIDGGYTWEALTTPANKGLNALYACGCNSAYVVGEALTTAVILKVSAGG